MISSKVPAIFISHGAPTLAVDEVAGADLAQWAEHFPRPRGVVVISAHWRENVLTRGSTAPFPKLIYDFDDYKIAIGRPELHQVKYRAPGTSELAYELAGLFPLERSDRGWDHGVWSPLRHMYPNADVPILQLSLLTGATPRRLFALGRTLGTLLERGYSIIGSGGITHNLAELNPNKDGTPADWARKFDAWVANLLADAEIDELMAWRVKGPEARRAHPTSEHLDPLFVVAGAASLYDHAVGFPVRGFEHGTLSRRCVQFGR